MKKRSQVLETVVHGVFLLLGLITVGCVLLISVYLIVSGIPAIRQIGLVPFLFGKTWASTAAEPSYGILPFILTSVYGTAGAIVLGVPLGFLTAVYLAKVAPPRLKAVLESAVSLLAGIPSVVYGLVGMLVLVPGIRKVFHLSDGASLLAAIVVLAIMILPSIIKVSVTALEAVPPEYEIFAAYPHSNEHLLLCHDFADADDFTAYFDAVQAQKSLQSNFRTDAWPEPGDRVLTLSTCFRGDNHQRYLVQGKLVAEAYAK